VARLLIDRGFTMVRPLAGGIDGWEEAGYQIESQPLVPITPPPTGSFPRPITGTSPRPEP
jgi:3-mercaptopyruvate sulfurtransferase SseA